MEALDQKEIMQRCIQGDDAALEQFVTSFSSLVYRCIQHVYKMRHLGRVSMELDDLHNTVFLRLFENNCRKLRQYKGTNGCSVATWIRVLTVRIVIDHLRKEQVDALTHRQAVLPIELLDAGPDGQSEPWPELERAEQWRRIREGMEALMPRDRLFLRFHCLEGFSVGETASLMGLTVSNAHSVKHRAIRRLREAVLGASRSRVEPAARPGSFTGG